MSIYVQSAESSSWIWNKLFLSHASQRGRNSALFQIVCWFTVPQNGSQKPIMAYRFFALAIMSYMCWHNVCPTLLDLTCYVGLTLSHHVSPTFAR